MITSCFLSRLLGCSLQVDAAGQAQKPANGEWALLCLVQTFERFLHANGHLLTPLVQNDLRVRAMPPLFPNKQCHLRANATATTLFPPGVGERLVSS